MKKSTLAVWIAFTSLSLSPLAFADTPETLKLDCENGYYDGTPAITADILDLSIENVEVTYLFGSGPMLPIKIASIDAQPGFRLTYMLTYILENDSSALETFTLPADLDTYAAGAKFTSTYEKVSKYTARKTTTTRTLNCTVNSK